MQAQSGLNAARWRIERDVLRLAADMPEENLRLR